MSANAQSVDLRSSIASVFAGSDFTAPVVVTGSSLLLSTRGVETRVTVSPPAGAQPPVRWGDEDVVAKLLGDGVEGVHSSVHTVTQRFRSAEAFADLFLNYYGPTYAAAQRLDATGRAALRADLVAHAEANARPGEDGLVTDWEYRIVRASRR